MKKKCFICGDDATYKTSRMMSQSTAIELYYLCDKHGVEMLNWILNEREKERAK